jgi:hypothetical protein
VAATDFAEPIAKGPWCRMRVVAEELDNSSVDDGARCCLSDLPVCIALFAYGHPASDLFLMKAAFVALLPQVLAEAFLNGFNVIGPNSKKATRL